MAALINWYGGDPCGVPWRGVTCDGGSVVSLDMAMGNRYSGTLPTQIGLLSRLTSLNLFDCAFSGTLPTQLGSLTRLTFLDLGYDSFNGVVPTELGSLSLLTFLHLGRNSFSGALPTELGRLTSVSQFYVVRMCRPVERTEVPRLYC